MLSEAFAIICTNRTGKPILSVKANIRARLKLFRLPHIATIAFVLTLFSTVKSHSCPHIANCDQSKCDIPSDCDFDRLVLDVCGCCQVCARTDNEPCGGQYGLLGRCEGSLVCELLVQPGQPVTGHEVGICMQPKHSCDVLKNYSGCSLTPDSQCACATFSACHDPQFQFKDLDQCQISLQSTSHLTPQQAKHRSNAVHQQESDCSDVECPHVVVKCPPDSYKLPSVTYANRCCSVPQRCECLPVACPQIVCPENTRLKIMKHGTGQPGSCCTQYQCISAGCVSSDGGKFFNEGDRWKEDDCVTCSCDGGQMRCQAEMCSVSCANPRKVPGQCCPICPEPTILTISPHCKDLKCDMQCPQGFSRDEDGCFICQCNTGLKVSETCDLECEHGLMFEEDGSQICRCRQSEAKECAPLAATGSCLKKCAHGFKVDRDGCEVCKCFDCAYKLKGCGKHCLNGYVEDERNCPICKCKDLNKTKAVSNSASPLQPTENESESVVIRPSKPLPVDSGQSFCVTSEGDSRHYSNGETWHDGCRHCMCHSGKEMCSLISCPVPRCKHPMIYGNNCCPKCLEDGITFVSANLTVCRSLDGRNYVEGETWHLDLCTVCLCFDGRVLCESHKCPPTPCSNPVRKGTSHCCKYCPDEDSDEIVSLKAPESIHCQSSDDLVRRDGSTWRVSPCQSCVCRRGEIKCFSDTCPLVNCTRPLLMKHACCPLCFEDGGAHCYHNNESYLEGSKWTSNTDACLECVCVDRHAICHRRKCPELNCSEGLAARRHSGFCCGSCQPVDSIPIISKFNSTATISEFTYTTIYYTSPVTFNASNSSSIKSKSDLGDKKLQFEKEESEKDSKQPSIVGILTVVIGSTLLMSVIVLVVCVVRHRRMLNETLATVSSRVDCKKDAPAKQTYYASEMCPNRTNGNSVQQTFCPLLAKEGTNVTIYTDSSGGRNSYYAPMQPIVD